MNKSLFVAGSFDDEGGKHSKIGDRLSRAICPEHRMYKNGGSFEELETILDQIDDFDIVFW